MAEPKLQGCRILVVEDEYFLAEEIATALLDAGAEILGPAPSVDAATALVESEEVIDAALLDVNLGGEPIFAVADALQARNVPFAFATGYDRLALPDRFSGITRLEKPIRPEQAINILKPLLEGNAQATDPG